MPDASRRESSAWPRSRRARQVAVHENEIVSPRLRCFDRTLAVAHTIIRVTGRRRSHPLPRVDVAVLDDQNVRRGRGGSEMSDPPAEPHDEPERGADPGRSRRQCSAICSMIPWQIRARGRWPK